MLKKYAGVNKNKHHKSGAYFYVYCSLKLDNRMCEGLGNQTGEFDPGSERTLAAWIRHASRTISFVKREIVANG